MQMIGMMVGSLLVGNLSDLFGRKKPLISSMAILFVFQLVCYFSVNWVMFAVGRVAVGKFSLCYKTKTTKKVPFNSKRSQPV